MSPAPESLKAGDHVFLVDGSSFVFRAYFQSIRQDAKYNYRSDGLPTGAVRLFCTKLFQFVREGAAGIKPTHLAIIFDKSENSFRKELYPPYKGNRSEPPEDLIPQFPLMRAAVRAFGLCPVEQDRYEADDLIATYAKEARAKGADVLIISADKDLMQLIEPGVAMYDPASGEAGAKGSREERRIGVDEVLSYFGVPPEKVVDVQALAGDSTDNVPGARGIGLKTAAQLINEYGDLDALLARAGEIKQPKRREILTDPDSVALIKTSKQLVSLVRDVPVETPLDDLRLAPPEGKALVSFFKALEFTTITKRAAEAYGIDAGLIEPDPAFAGPNGWRGRNGDPLPEPEPGEPAPEGAAPQAAAEGGARRAPARNARYGEQAPQKAIATGPGELAAARASAALTETFDVKRYETVASLERLDAIIAEALEAGLISVDTETSSLDPMQADLVGISLCVAPGRASYIPLRHVGEGAGDLFGGGELAPGQLPADEVLARLKPLLETLGRPENRAEHEIRLARLRPARRRTRARRGHAAAFLCSRRRTQRPWHGCAERKILRPQADPVRRGGGLRPHLHRLRPRADRQGDRIFRRGRRRRRLRLWRVLKPRLAAERMSFVYETLERPMIEVLDAHGARAAFRSIAASSPGSPANSRRTWRGSRR